MQSSPPRTLQTAYDRFGPDPNQYDLGAGCVAALAAVVAAAVYVAVVAALDSGVVGVDRALYFAELELHWVWYSATRGLLVVVPAAFLVGVIGDRLLPRRTALSGLLAGGLGTVVTYLLAFVFLSVGMAASGEAIWTALELSALFVVVAFVFTWWVTLPVGCLTGALYTRRTGSAG